MEADFKTIYDACTPDERRSVLIAMLEKIEARRADEVKALVANPKQLAGIPLSRLQEIADVGIQDAHAWIIETFPQITDVLISLECLISFTFASEEPSANGLTDVITSLEEIWKAAGGKYADDLFTDSRAHLEADHHAAPGRPTIDGTRESARSARSTITTRPPAGPRSKARRLGSVSTETKGTQA